MAKLAVKDKHFVITSYERDLKDGCPKPVVINHAKQHLAGLRKLANQTEEVKNVIGQLEQFLEKHKD